MTTDQRAAVKKVVAAHQEEVAQLGIDEATAFMPVLDKAQAELAAQLKQWVAREPNGEFRWTAQSYRNALMQIHASQKQLHEHMRDRLDVGGETASTLGAEHLIDDVARFSKMFGTAQKLTVKPASLVASGRSYLVRRHETSAARYAGQVGKDIQQRLSVDILKGAKVQETIKRLQESGGPSGLVHMGAGKYEYIPEGLFTRYRYWAERLVRTEVSSAYCTTSTIGRQEAGRLVHGLQKKVIADGNACPMCLEQTDQTVEENDVFVPSGMSDPPFHPFCGCSVVPWKSDWGDLLGDIDPFFKN